MRNVFFKLFEIVSFSFSLSAIPENIIVVLLLLVFCW